MHVDKRPAWRPAIISTFPEIQGRRGRNPLCLVEGGEVLSVRHTLPW